MYSLFKKRNPPHLANDEAGWLNVAMSFIRTLTP